MVARGRRSRLGAALAALVAVSLTVALASALVLSSLAEGELQRPLTLGAGSGPRHGVDLDPEQQNGARALARAIEALDAGDLDAAQSALDVARDAEPIADYVGLQRVRWLDARGKHKKAAKLAAQLGDTHPDSPLRGELARLRGNALAARGDEAAARAAWMAALGHDADAGTRRAIKLDIIASRQRAGELPSDVAAERLLASAFAEDVGPGDLPPGQRSAEMALRAADDLVAGGRGADAIDAYREAIAGGLEGDALRRARLQQGIAMFRLRRYADALPVFELLGRDVEGRFWRARTLARLGRVDESIIGFEALAGSPVGPVATRSAYLAATLLEDRDESVRAMAHYARVAADPGDPEGALDALWRIGWAAWKRGDDVEASRRFAEMAARSKDDEPGRLRPLYWEARSIERMGDAPAARANFEAISREWPLSYYGWRAQQRIGRLHLAAQGPPDPAADRDGPTLAEAPLVRVALLIEAGLVEAAREELVPIAARARSRADHVRVGRVMVAAGDYYRAQRLVADGYPVPLARGLRAGDEALLWLSWPPAYRDIVEQSVVGLAGVEPALVWAIMREESSFRPKVMSSAGAIGLLQIMPETARRQAKRSGVSPIDRDEELFEPVTNIALGSAYLDYLAGRFPDRLSATIGGYNAGPNAVDRWLRGDAAEWDDDVWVEDIPYGQTRRYVKRVLRSLHVYRTFY